MIGPKTDVGDFLGPKRAHDFRGRAHDQRPRRDVRALGDERVCADDATLADDGAVEDRGAHANEALVFDRAGVEDGAVTDGYELADAHRQIVGEMDDASVLDVGALADIDEVDVATQDGGGPDAAAGSEPHIADDHGLSSQIGGRIDLRLNKEKARALGRIHAAILDCGSFFVQFRGRICYRRSVRLPVLTKLIVLGAIVLAWPASAQANVGDTLPELRARYGSAKDLGGQMLFEVRLVNGQIVPARGSADADDHFTIAVYFDGDNSAMEVFTRNTSDPVKANLTQKDIDTILAATNDGQTWNPIQVPTGRTTWMRSDNKLLARFSPNTSGKADDASVLVIMLNGK